MTTTVKDYRESRLYKLAFKKLQLDGKVKHHYTSNTFKVVEENFDEIILQGLELLFEANKRQIKI